MDKKLVKTKGSHLSRVDIEQRVNGMLDKIFPERGNDPRPPDLKQIVDVLDSRYNILFSFDKQLGRLSEGVILGEFSVEPLSISISPTLSPWSPRFCKTLAHEIGHLVLHRKLIGKGKYISKEKPVVDTAKQLRYREMAELSDLGWAEWQANEFAMSLVLPRKYIQALVIFSQTILGINNNLGTMYFDDQPCNQSDCHKVANCIVEKSGADKTLLWRRLRFLGILEDRRSIRERSLFDSLDSLFEVAGC